MNSPDPHEGSKMLFGLDIKPLTILIRCNLADLGVKNIPLSCRSSFDSSVLIFVDSSEKLFLLSILLKDKQIFKSIYFFVL
jgi:hypothetical protein